MAYNPQNGTAGTPTLPEWPIWPDELVRGVIADAHAVEREARRMEREARALEWESGGHPLIGAILSFRVFRDAVQMLSRMSQSLQDEELTPEQRQLVDDVAPKIAALAAEIDGSAPVAPTFSQLLEVAQELQQVCEQLQDDPVLPGDQHEALALNVRRPVEKVIAAIKNLMESDGSDQPERGASSPPPRGERK